MSVRIEGIVPDSPADKKRISVGDILVSISGNSIRDILDYQFYAVDANAVLELETSGGKRRKVRLRNLEYEDLGLLFSGYLMDKQQSCKNKCVFCFIDQLPKGMRESLYFKDDDERLSFLFGNYVTLTNLTDDEIDRIIKYRISPINVSVHTTDPELRVFMMKNPKAADILKTLRKLADGLIEINCQLVLCPGINDGEELNKSLDDLKEFLPQLKSIACVPVGLTDYRQGLCKLESFTEKSAQEVVSIIDNFNRQFDEPVAFASDEFYLLAKRQLPPASYYGDFVQLENGVGMCAYLEEQIVEALEEIPISDKHISISLATGALAALFLEKILIKVKEKYLNIDYNIYKIENRFFGKKITVSGLLTGKDVIEQLKDKDLGERLLLPSNMLDNANEKTLDDIKPSEISEALDVPIRFVDNDGWDFIDVINETVKEE